MGPVPQAEERWYKHKHGSEMKEKISSVHEIEGVKIINE
jgi:hypothetical protein